MKNTDLLYSTLKSIENGKSHFGNLNYSFEIFLSEWIQEKTKDWEGILNQLQTLNEKLIQEFESSIPYVFTTRTSYLQENPGSQVFGSDSESFPKMPKMPKLPIGDSIILNKQEEQINLRQNQAASILPELLKLRKTISKCLFEYVENNDSPIFNPKYKVVDRIPFRGNEQALSVFANLLIKGGFILANEFVSEDILNESDRAKFKGHTLAKKELAKRLTEIFYCVEKEKDTENIKTVYPKSSNLASKMQLETMKRMDKDDIEQFQNGFNQILISIKEALK